MRAALALTTLLLCLSNTARADDGPRPEGTTVGLGAALDTGGGQGGIWGAFDNGLKPDRVTFRVRTAGGFGIEPSAAYQKRSTTPDDGDTTETSSSQFALTLRPRLTSRGAVDLSLPIVLDRTATSHEDSEDDTKATGLSLGVGLEYFFNPHVSFGLDGLQRLVDVSDDSRKSRWVIDAGFVPEGRVSVHLYL